MTSKTNFLFSLYLLILFFIGMNSTVSQINIRSIEKFVFFSSNGAVASTNIINISDSTGDVGSNLGVISGFGPPSIHNGTIQNVNTVTAQAAVDLTDIVAQINATTNTNSTHAAVFGNGETLPPGVYSIGVAGSIAGTLTLDGQGNKDAQFIFKIGGEFSTGIGTKVVLINCASPTNVFWITTGAIVMAASTSISGNIISNPGAVSMGVGGKLYGRLLSTLGAVSISETLAVNINTWKGTINNKWNTPENWTQNRIANCDTDIIFNATPVNHLVLDQNRTATNITNAQSTYKVVCNGFQLTLKGNTLFTNGAQIDASASNSTLEFAGSAVQTISASNLYNNTVYNLKINNINNVIANGNLRVLNVVTATSGRLDAITNAPTITYGGVSSQTMESGQYLNEKIYNVNVDNAAGVLLATNFIIDNNLTINSGKTFKIEAAKNLTVTGVIANAGGSAGFVLKSTAAGTAALIHNTDNIAATVQRYISGAAKEWHFLSAPVSNQEIVASPWVPSGTYGNGTGYDLYIWDEPTPCWTYQLNTTVAPTWPSIHPTSNFVRGRGYLYATQAANPTKEFIGLLNNGTVNYPITNTAAGLDPVVRGFNLIGNPYPSSIDWKSSSGWTRSNLVSSGGGYDMWIWNPAANNYGVYNSLGATGTNGVTQYIPPTQGYFVRAASSGNIAMSNSTRVSNGASNWLKIKRSKTTNLKVRIASNEGHGYDEVLLQFGYPKNEAGALKLFSRNKAAPSVYLNDVNKDLSVRYLTDTAENASIPLLFKSGREGWYLFNIDLDTDFFDVLLLEDKKTKTITDLKANPTYQFKGSIQDAANRFVLHFKPFSIEKDILPAKIYYDGKEIIIDLNSVENKSEVTFYDIQGKLILYKTVGGKSISHNTVSVKNQLIIVLVSSQNKSVSRKVFVY